MKCTRGFISRSYLFVFPAAFICACCPEWHHSKAGDGAGTVLSEGSGQIAGSTPSGQDPPELAATIVMTDAMKFQPARVTIRAGQMVLWTNTSDHVQTVTADSEKAMRADDVEMPPEAEPFDSGTINPGGTFAHTFDLPGIYRYFSVPHEYAGMVGEIRVEPAG